MLDFIKTDRARILLCSMVAMLLIFWHIYGVVNRYSPLPFWDAWVSYVLLFRDDYVSYFNFFFKPHNSSHIIFTHRVFEYIDLHFFGFTQRATTFSLAFSSLALPLLVTLTFRKELRELPWMIIVIVGLMTSWTQKENFTWAFQDQMYWVLLFAFLTIVSAKHYVEEKKFIYILPFATSAFLATFSMGNGFLVILIICGSRVLQMAQSRSIDLRSITLLVTSGIILSFWQYLKTSSDEAATSVNLSFSMSYDVLALIGSPLNLALGLNKFACIFFGAILLVVFLWALLLWLKEKKLYIESHFLGFLMLTAIAIIIVRSTEFENSWQVSRYQGLVMSIWVFCLFTVLKIKQGLMVRRIVGLCGGLLIIGSLIKNHDQYYPNKYHEFERSMGILSFMNEVNDTVSLNLSFPWHDVLGELTATAMRERKGVFGLDRFSWAHDHLGTENAIEGDFSGSLKMQAWDYQSLSGSKKLFALIECPKEFAGSMLSISLGSEKSYPGLLFNDEKNFQNWCRIGAYVEEEVSMNDINMRVGNSVYSFK